MDDSNVIQNIIDFLAGWNVFYITWISHRLIWLMWLVALSLLALKLLWRPLDKATTYGKLLYNEQVVFTNSKAIASTVSPRTTTTNSKTKTASISSSTQHSRCYSIFNQRFSFTAGYILSLIWTLMLLTCVFACIFLVHNYRQNPTLYSCSTAIKYDSFVSKEDGKSIGDQLGHEKLILELEQKSLEENSIEHLSSQQHHFQKIANVFPVKLQNFFDSVHFDHPATPQRAIDPTFCELFNVAKNLLNQQHLKLSFSEIISIITYNVNSIRLAVIAFAIILHLTRRSFECLFVHVFSHRPMPIWNTLLIWSYYFVMPLTPVFDITLAYLRDLSQDQLSNLQLQNGSFEASKTTLIISLCSILIGFILFLFGNYVQAKSHVILANLRKVPIVDQTSSSLPASSNRYAIPKGGFFSYVSCPHYMSEIIIYCGIGFICGWTSGVLLLFIFVMITMFTQALKTHDWYKKRFKSQYPKERRAIVPYIC